MLDEYRDPDEVIYRIGDRVCGYAVVDDFATPDLTGSHLTGVTCPRCESGDTRYPAPSPRNVSIDIDYYIGAMTGHLCLNCNLMFKAVEFGYATEKAMIEWEDQLEREYYDELMNTCPLCIRPLHPGLLLSDTNRQYHLYCIYCDTGWEIEWLIEAINYSISTSGVDLTSIGLYMIWQGIKWRDMLMRLELEEAPNG